MPVIFSDAKRIVLILFISACGLSTKAQTQQQDTTTPKISAEEKAYLTSQLNKSYIFLQCRTGFLGGFQTLSKDSAYIAVSIPIEYNFRYFPPHILYHYWDFSLGFQAMVLNRSTLTTIYGGSVAWGSVSKTYNDNAQIHVGYYHGAVKDESQLRAYGDIVLIGYGFEVQSVPLVFDVYLPVHQSNLTKNTVLQVGIKLPIISTSISHSQLNTLTKSH